MTGRIYDDEFVAREGPKDFLEAACGLHGRDSVARGTSLDVVQLVHKGGCIDELD